MARTAKPSNPQRIEALRSRMTESDYLDSAIAAIATSLANRILYERTADEIRLPANVSSGEPNREGTFDRYNANT